MDAIVQRVVDGPFERVNPMGRSLLSQALNGGEVAQQQIADMSRRLIAASTILMPPQTVRSYVALRCADYDLGIDGRYTPDFKIVPTWAEMDGTVIPPGTTARQRAPSCGKFSHRETMNCLDFSVRCGDVLQSAICLQRILEDYLALLRERVAAIDPDAGERVGLVREHWGLAGNFARTLHIALIHVMPDKRDPAAAFQAINHYTVTAAFRFLDESRSFDFPMPADVTVSGKPLAFTCPVKPLLEEFIVRQGVWTEVIAAIKRLAAGGTVLPERAQTSYLMMDGLVRETVEATRRVVRNNAPDAYAMLQMMTHQACQPSPSFEVWSTQGLEDEED